MTTRRTPRCAIAPRAVAVLAVLLAAIGALSVQRADAVTGADWNPGRIVDDGQFFEPNALTQQQIADVITAQGANCTDGAVPCLKNYSTSTPSIAAEAGLCEAMPATTSSTAAAIIHSIAQACGISPKVILVMIQKESGLVSTRTPIESMYRTTTGFACPDTAPCDSQYFGFFNQVYRMARQFQVYTNNPSRYGYQKGRHNTILYNPNLACGSSSVYIQNQATANLYIYTPYQPNQAALDNLYGEGDSCSAYGNRNFWRLFNDWFGPSVTPPRAPLGKLEGVTVAGSTVSLSGWMLDLDSPAVAGSVAVYRNGVGISWLPVSRPRADVNAAYGVSGNHGFAVELSNEPVGTNTYCVYAIDNEYVAGNPLLGCRSIFVSRPPLGNFEGASAMHQSVSLSGWTLDTDSPTVPGHVAVYRNGGGIGWFAVDRLRSDVNAAHGVSGDHGFAVDLANEPVGTNTYCVYAIDNEGTAQNPSLGCRVLQVVAPPTTPPFGNYEAASVTHRTVSLSGWMLDIDSPTVPGHVAVYRNGEGIGWFAVDRLRSDVNAAHGVSGDHGFAVDLANEPVGTNTYCVYAIDNEYVTGNPSLGCRSVQVSIPLTPPFGNYEGASASGKSVTLSGWMLDPDSLGTSGHVAVYRNGTGISWFEVSDFRPDVNGAFGASGNHGWTVNLMNQPVGAHSYCVFAIDNEQAAGNPLLACRSVTVT